MFSKLEISTRKEEITVVIVVCVGSIIIVLSNFLLGSISSIINYCVLLFIIISSYLWLNKEPWRVDQIKRLSFTGREEKKQAFDESFEESPIKAILLLVTIIFVIAILGPLEYIDLMGTLILGITAAGIIIYFALKTRIVDRWAMIIAIVLVISLISWEFIRTFTYYESIILPEDISFGFLVITSVLLLSFFCIVQAGVLLVKSTNITQVRLLEKEFYPMLKSVGVGLFLGIPWGLVSASNIVINQETEAYWWQPLVVFIHGLNEEIWARLFFIPIAFILLRSFTETEERCLGAIIFVVIIQIELLYPVTIWLGYFPYIFRTALFWYVPLGYLFVRRDFETVLSFHLMIEAIPLLLFLIVG